MKITVDKAVIEQALEALEKIGMRDWVERKEAAITALRQAIEHAEQEQLVEEEDRCQECGYLTKHTEHIGCLRQKINVINDFEKRNFAIVNMDTAPPPRQPDHMEDNLTMVEQAQPVYFCDYGCEGWVKVDEDMAAANLAHGMTVEAYYPAPPPRQPDQSVEHCLWARNGNTPCPHTTPTRQSRSDAQPLTDEQILSIIVSIGPEYHSIDLARAIEAVHGIKGEA